MWGWLQCIPSWYWWDGDNDCSDGSDEDTQLCYNYTCPADRWKCGDGSMCILSWYWCDGDNDCIDCSD